MKNRSTSQSTHARCKLCERGFFYLRGVIGLFVIFAGLFLAMLNLGIFGQTNSRTDSGIVVFNGGRPNSVRPDVVRLIGPVILNQDLRALPYIPREDDEFEEHHPLPRHPHPKLGAPPAEISPLTWLQSLLKELSQATPKMPPPLLTFDGMNVGEGGCGGCLPPDTNGDVGPNHYVEGVNIALKIFDKNGNTLAGPITFNSFFAPLGGGTPCGSNQNKGDNFVFYDQVADRWIVSDFAFPTFPGSSFWQCIGVSQTGDPVGGSWNLYALQIDPANPTEGGDYPKFALWNNPQPDGAYFLTVNLFSSPTSFDGVRVFALDRGAMLNGAPASVIAFTIPPVGLGDSYSLVPASFRTDIPPPVDRDEFLLDIDSPATDGTILTDVHGWAFHVDFDNPGNSTLGLGPNHSPDAEITVNGFIDAFTAASGWTIIPQPGTSQRINSLGDKIMIPIVYQNRNGTESLWATSTVCLDTKCSQPTGIRWYQFDVTGGTFPAAPVQQQTWTNDDDGLWRFMPSIAVNANGSTAVAYSVSSSAVFPGIRYAGRLESDLPNDLGQGEATMTDGSGSQLDSTAWWGDYSMTTVDPNDGMTFWHTNEYYTVTSVFSWHTRIGKFQFPAASPTPTPRATPTPRITPTPRARPTPVPRP